jgi:hypothetical protein
MRRLAPLALLLACTPADNTITPTSSVTSSPTPPAAAPPTTPDPDEDLGGFADPRVADPPPPAPAQPAPDPALAARVTEKFGERCKLERSCGELLGVDCGAAVDGPYYYVQRADLKTVSTCGGACMGGRCTDCPPKAWTCATY